VKKLLWQLHSWMGLLAGIGLLVIGLTGSLLVFPGELDAVTAPKLFLAQPALSTSTRLPLDILFADVERALPDYEISSWLPASEPGAVDRVFVVKHHHYERLLVTVNPYTGAILCSPLDARRTATGRIMELHYTFFAGGIGTFLAGLFAVLLCLLGVSGFWIYQDFWSNFIRLRWRASRQIFLSDLHKTVGISTVVFQLILGFTGAYWNIPAALRQFRSPNAHPPELTARHWSRNISLDALVDRASHDLPGFQATFIGFPAVSGADLQVIGHAGSAFRSDYDCTAVFDAQSGALKSIKDIRKAGLGDQIIDTFRPLHYGTFGGLFIKIIWCAGGLTPGLLAVTGYLMWRRRQPGAAPGN
jgi:uncharacterized iron-regulated membrane protein